MKAYQTLIKLEKIEIDRIKKEMTSMHQAIDENHKILGQLNEALEQEKKAYNHANQEGIMAGNFDQFYQVNRHKYTNVKHQIDLLEEQLEIKQDALQLHFGELKKIEHMLEQKLLEQKKQQDVKEQKFLDEFRRKAS